jgi:hypothetical protein
MKNAANNLVSTLRDSLSSSQKKFLAEVLGTFIVVVFATGSVVIDAKMSGAGYSLYCVCPLCWSSDRRVLVWKNVNGTL